MSYIILLLQLSKLQLSNKKVKYMDEETDFNDKISHLNSFSYVQILGIMCDIIISREHIYLRKNSSFEVSVIT